MTGHGRLVLVATPIGNLADLSERAATVLREADVICCEDTRRTGRLLEHLGHRAPLLRVFNEHTEEAVIPEILDRVKAGELVAVVSDAGTPGISDPGERLVARARRHDLVVESVPGPTALVTALITSGMPTGRFVFEGFLPRRGAGRRSRLSELASEQRTIVLYEAPHRLGRTLADLASVCGGQRPVAIARELTKLHEQHWSGSLDEAIEHVSAREPRGEHVLVLAGAPEAPPATDEAILAGLDREREAGRSTRDAVAMVASTLDVPKRRVYDLATGA